MSEPVQPTAADLRRQAAIASNEEAVENAAITNARRERDEALGALGQARKDRDDYADELQQEEARSLFLHGELVKIRNMTDQAISEAYHGAQLEEVILGVFGIAHRAAQEPDLQGGSDAVQS